MDDIAREHIDINILRLLYSRYKDFIVPFLVIVVVIGLFLKVTGPAIQDLFKGYEEQKTAMLTLGNMRNKLNFLKGVDDSSIDSQFRIVTRTLPVDKDFTGVLNAISDASNKSGAVLGGFKFVVGSLSKVEDISEYPSLNLSITLSGNVKAVDNFIGILVKTLPLSEVTKISSQMTSSTIAIDFYYKVIKPSKYDDSLPLSIVSANGRSLIDELSTFDIPESPVSDSVYTPSANPFF